MEENVQSNFVSRAARYSLRLPVRFFTPEGLFLGESTNISESGVSVLFEESVDIWLVGELYFHVEGRLASISLEDRQPSVLAKVARSNGPETGLSFKINTGLDSDIVRDLVEIARAASGGQSM